jgi:hypothetical protein
MQALSVQAFQGLPVQERGFLMFPFALYNTEVIVLKGLERVIVLRRAPTHVSIACVPGLVKRAGRSTSVAPHAQSSQHDEGLNNAGRGGFKRAERFDQQGFPGDCQKPTLRSGFRQRLKPGVGRERRRGKTQGISSRSSSQRERTAGLHEGHHIGNSADCTRA